MLQILTQPLDPCCYRSVCFHILVRSLWQRSQLSNLFQVYCIVPPRHASARVQPRRRRIRAFSTTNVSGRNSAWPDPLQQAVRHAAHARDHGHDGPDHHEGLQVGSPSSMPLIGLRTSALNLSFQHICGWVGWVVSGA